MKAKVWWVFALAILLGATALVVAACGDDDDDDAIDTDDDDDDDNDNNSPAPDADCVAAYTQVYDVCGMSFPGYTKEEMIEGNCYGSQDAVFGVDGAIVECYRADPTCEAFIVCIAAFFEPGTARR